MQRGGDIRTRFSIARAAHHLPARIETSETLSSRLGRSGDWIVQRTGVRERRVSDESMAVMAAHAGREVLGGVPPDLIVNASLTPVQLIPDSSVFVQRELGYSGIPSFSVHATCLSFLVALRVVGALVEGGAHRRVLIVSSEQGSVSRDFEEAESAALIGDGAAAVLVEPASEGVDSGLLGYAMRTFPEGADHAEFRGAGTRFHPNDPRTSRRDNLFHMNGPRLWRLALRHADDVLDQAFGEAGLTRKDVDVILPHQASGPMVSLFSKFGFDQSKVVDQVGDWGNCIAASMPMVLSQAVADGRLKRGGVALLFGTGAGLSIGAALLRY
jgi:3-oxoacyl-[acyl-carrier-protein] synthase-3